MCKNVAMDDTAAGWPAELMERLGKAIAAARTASGMSAVKLAEATAVIGVPIHRVAIAKIENGGQVVTVPELVALGVALEADWPYWLTKAVEGLPIEETAHWRSLLVDVESQMDMLRRNLLRVEEGPKRFDMPDGLRDKLMQDAQQYREMIVSLEAQRKMILSMLDGPGA